MTDRDDDRKVIRVEWTQQPIVGDQPNEVLLGIDPGGPDGHSCTVVLLSIDGHQVAGHRADLVIVDDPHDDQQLQLLRGRLELVLERWGVAMGQLAQSFRELAASVRVASVELEAWLSRMERRPLRLPDEVLAELDRLIGSTAKATTAATDWHRACLRADALAWPRPTTTETVAWRPHHYTTSRRRRGPWTLPRMPA